MSDHQGDFVPLDPGRIHAMDPLELEYWCKELSCTEEKLKEAVSKVGEHVTAVREHLESQG